MQRAFADESEQRGFRLRLEAMLRAGEADAALALVRQGLEAIADNGLPIVDIALATHPEALSITGWEAAAAAIAQQDARGAPVTALGIDLSWPGHIGREPDAAGAMAPYIETSYFTDLAEIAFSTARRDDIVAGYSDYGSHWQGCFAEFDNALEIDGLERLYGAVIGASDSRDSDDVAGDAYVLAASTSAILLHIAVRRAIAAGALPRAMAVIVGSNEDFPFFDAPVVSVDEARALMPAAPPAAPPPVEAQPPEAFAPEAMPDDGAAEDDPAPPPRGLLSRLLRR